MVEAVVGEQTLPEELGVFNDICLIEVIGDLFNIL
jgi:hypothetical protein